METFDKQKMKISIITVVFNAVDTIEKTLQSVINQGEDVQYIVIDGGSSDGTLNIIERYKDYISCFISEKDTGIYNAMNKGLEHATGDIIGIINADDYYADGILKKMKEIFQNEDIDIVHGNIKIIKNNGQINELMPNLKQNFMNEMCFFHPTFFIKKETYKKVGHFNEKYKISADFDLFVRMKKEGYNFYYYPHVITFMKDGGRSVSGAEIAIIENYIIATSNKGNKVIARFIYYKRMLRLYLSYTIFGVAWRRLKRCVK